MSLRIPISFLILFFFLALHFAFRVIFFTADVSELVDS